MSVASYDVVVVGGGINGVGVAQAAAAAGYSVMLLEKQAVAARRQRQGRHDAAFRV